MSGGCPNTLKLDVACVFSIAIPSSSLIVFLSDCIVGKLTHAGRGQSMHQSVLHPVELPVFPPKIGRGTSD